MTFAQLLHLLDLTPEQWVQLFLHHPIRTLEQPTTAFMAPLGRWYW
ncbi:hypothetical protein [Nocardia sp. NPDC005745]